MVFNSEHLYAAAGSVNDAWNYQYNRNGVYDYLDDSWNFKGYFNQPVLDSVLDFISLAIDPRDGALWAGSYGGGLVRFKENQTTIYKQKNSSLQAALGDPNSYRVSGLAFDQAGNLWVANYGAAQNMQVRKKDSSWVSIRVPFSHTENALSQILVDQEQQIWLISPKGNGIFCYNPGNSIDATNDDRWKNYLAGSGNGNLPSNNVRCMAMDKNGFIWVGTDKGIGIIQCSNEVFGTGCEALLPVVQQDRFAGLLFQDEDVQSIVVDGANRKWVGTKNGLWLLSPEGDKIIYRFTQDISPLLGNDIKKLAINSITGELFIASTNGICSFRSTATEGGNTQENVLVFPNPVPAGYNGTIAIRGLSNNALIKITELNGQLVYQTRALGGQAIWDGKHYTGSKAASGVYLVIVRDDTGKEKIATKIVLLSGR
jgi:ligand-binding sensor domain-containing protein